MSLIAFMIYTILHDVNFSGFFIFQAIYSP